METPTAPPESPPPFTSYPFIFLPEATAVTRIIPSGSENIEEPERIFHKRNSLVKICSISLRKTDQIFLVGCSDKIINKIRNTIKNYWGQIQAEYVPGPGSHEYKLLGNPWHYINEEFVNSSRYLLGGLLTCMAANGWNLVQGIDVNRFSYGIDTLFFENSTPDPIPDLFVLHFKLLDSITVVDASEEISNSLKEAVGAMWTKGFKSVDIYQKCFQIKFESWPYYQKEQKEVMKRLLLCQILANFRSLGYKLYGSIDTFSGDPKTYRETESWIFRKIGPCWS